MVVVDEHDTDIGSVVGVIDEIAGFIHSDDYRAENRRS